MIATRLRFLLFVILAAATSARGEVFFDPVAPTDHDAVMLRVREIWRDGCLPQNPQVTRSGRNIAVRFATPRGTGCPLAVMPWESDVPLGMFPAGLYDVVVEVDDQFSGLVTIARLRLVVSEGAPLLRIEPGVVSTAGGTEIAIHGFCRDRGPVPTDVLLLIDDVIVPSRVEFCIVRATLPPHAAGPVDVTVIGAGRRKDVVNGLQYVDPAATPEPRLYERVLVPVIYDGPGAFGSQWVTNGTMRNDSPLPETEIEFLPEVMRPLTRLAAGATTSLSVFGNRPNGLVLFVPRGSEVGFGSMVRDVSRDASQFGTEIPIVREGDTSEVVVLEGVPFDPRYRLQLRIYAIDGATASVLVSVGNRSAYREVRGPCATLEGPCNSNAPAFDAVDLGQLFPGVTGLQRVRIAGSTAERAPLWAFVTVTNNQTQHVTVISPQ